MDATSSRFLSNAPQLQSDMRGLPDDLVLQIVLRIRDTDSLRSLWQTCKGFASLSQAPAFANAMTDQVFIEQCALLRTLDMPARPARIYQIASKMATRMQVPHLQQMMACLGFPDENGSARLDASPAANGEAGSILALIMEPIRESIRVPAIIGAAISSGRVEGFNEQVKQYALQLIHGVQWVIVCLSPLGLDLPTGTASNATLTSDALCGIWLHQISPASALLPNSTFKGMAASSLLKAAEPLPMKCKLPLFEAIMDAGVIEVRSMSLAHHEVVSSLERSARHPERLELPLANRLFALLGGVIDAVIATGDLVSVDHLLFARMLPPLPWRENSRRALEWLMKALPRVLDVLSPQAIEHLIPAGIFSGKEIAYLSQSLSDGSFSWESLQKIDAAGSDK